MGPASFVDTYFAVSVGTVALYIVVHVFKRKQSILFLCRMVLSFNVKEPTSEGPH
jgi:hypothetical protein